MKKSFSKYFVISVAFSLVFIFSYMFLLSENKRFAKAKLEKQNILSQKQSDLNDVLVELQKLSSEDRIVQYATEQLGLIRQIKKIDVIPINKKQIIQINKLVKRKYE